MARAKRWSEKALVLARGALLCCGLPLVAYAVLFRCETWAIFMLAGLACLGVRRLTPRPPATGTWKSALTAAALSGASTLLALVICEAAARLFIPEIAVGGTPRTEMHPKYLHMLKPGVAGLDRITLDDGSIGSCPFRISNQGLRDREYGPKSVDEFRILMLGDSFTFGTGLYYEQTIPKRLEALLSQTLPGKQVSVINAGSQGYGPWQELGLLIERGFPLEPDLVILQVLPDNDIADTLIREGIILPAHQRRLTQGRIRCLYYFTDWKMRLETALLLKSRLYRAVSVWSDGAVNAGLLLNHMRLFHNPAIPEIPPSVARPWYIECARRDWYAELEEGWRLFETDVLAIRAACQERGVDFVVFSVPSGIGLRDDAWRHCTGLSGDPQGYERGKETRMAHAFFERERLPRIPIDDALRNHPNPASLFFRFDGHFTPEGADVTARRIADYLLANRFQDHRLSGDDRAVPRP